MGIIIFWGHFFFGYFIVSRPYFGLDNFLLQFQVVFCIIGSVAASLASTH